jgi:ribonuclease P/MRP protein subunit RPP1
MTEESGLYAAAHPTPRGESTLARLAATATRCGFDGLVARSPPDGPETPPDTDASAYLADVAAEYGLDVVHGVEIDPADPAEARGHVGSLREDATVLILRGGTPALNRFALESPRVDVLAAPMCGEGDLNHVLARAAARNDVRVEFDLARVLRASGGRRVRALRGLRKLRELVAQYDVPHVLSVGARSHLALRAPRELAAVGAEVGLEAATVRAGLAEWGRLACRNRERQSAAHIADGVRRGLPEEWE